MNAAKPYDKPEQDRTEDVFRTVKHLKDTKFKGELTLMFDGSGRVAKVKKSEFV